MATIEISCNFVGSFKVGDNLQYNCDVLCELVEANADSKFSKMIVLQTGAILEAALTQIIYRAQNFNMEGVPNIHEEDRQSIEGKKIDKFAVTIDVLRKYGVLEGVEGEVYEDLHRLRRFRNKIHIQDDVSIVGIGRDENTIFDEGRTNWALSLNRRVLCFLSEHLARLEHIHEYVGTLRVPS